MAQLVAPDGAVSQRVPLYFSALCGWETGILLGMLKIQTDEPYGGQFWHDHCGFLDY